MLTCVLAVSILAASPIRLDTQRVSVGARKVNVQFVRLSLDEYAPDIAWPMAGLGFTDDMAAVAKAARAAVAINGCFFDAYLDTVRKNPNQNLIAGGRLLHIGGTGATLGFDAEGKTRLERVRLQYRGSVRKPNGRESSWYAYRVNHTPTGASYAGYYDRAYGGTVDFDGLKVVVVSGRATHVTRDAVTIPSSGYVLLFGDAEASLQRRFEVGDAVEIGLYVEDGTEEFWRRAVTGIGGGPKLVTRGAVDLRFEEEGFRDPKITSASGARSLVGVDKEGRLVLAVSSGTIREMANLMLALGCLEAMNLDGGASSGLWIEGQGYVRKPGRLLNNLLVLRRR
ncbi:MAG: phosphodiester glycosidase family protein [Fimbriimonadaceae bacterium]|nr:phosphodiester glycosidase family protein [Fimbriimonadaceae bacterium]